MEPGTFINIAGCTCPIFGIMKILLHKDAFAVVAKFIKTRIGQSQKRIRQGIMPSVAILIIAIQDGGIPIRISGQDHVWEAIPLIICVGVEVDIRKVVLHADGDEVSVIGENVLEAT